MSDGPPFDGCNNHHESWSLGVSCDCTCMMLDGTVALAKA
jgi:hypothetical protein